MPLSSSDAGLLAAVKAAGGNIAEAARQLGISRSWASERFQRLSVPGDEQPRKHIVIPDTQVKPDVPLDHFHWIGQYIEDKAPDVVVHLGDHFDMPSLSSYDKGTVEAEGRRYQDDIEAGQQALAVLDKYMGEVPEKHFITGNHEDRISRAARMQPELYGTLSLDDLDVERHGWHRHEFLVPVLIDGVMYVHYAVNPMSGRPLGGMMPTRLKTVGRSFTMGHQQTLDMAIRFLPTGEQQRGLVAGAAYLHAENYKGAQGNPHWRGIIVKHHVRDGAYDLMEVSLDYLCRRSEGVSLRQFMKTKYGLNEFGLSE